QKQRWLPGICDGTGTMAFAITEPDAGTNTHNITTTARRHSDEWVLNGRKVYISGVDEADHVLVVARAEDAKTGKVKPVLFVVPTDADGFSSQEIHGKLGLKGSDTAELSLDGVEVGDDALMGQIGDGFKIAMSALDSGRYSVAAGCVGICQASLDASVAYAKERTQF
ncbi:acyl-CoA dehydrogenase, partial [Klebsiella pneumoniae]|uniref:acyl-CoA dehydrogenase family protein n=1 Tax=Klebsiella pneumoniae TaxID=573 RepID=UPI003A86F1B2